MSYRHPDGTPEERLMRYLRAGRYSTIADMDTDLNMSAATRARAVRSLIDAGVITKTYAPDGAVTIALADLSRPRLDPREALVREAAQALKAAAGAVAKLEKALRRER